MAMSSIVSAVIMTTVVVGPFYLAKGLGLGLGAVGLSLSVGPLVASLSGLPAGRVVDRFGARQITLAGLTGIAAGSAANALVPASLGLVAYLAPVAVVSASYVDLILKLQFFALGVHGCCAPT
jgi:MFS family permease